MPKLYKVGEDSPATVTFEFAASPEWARRYVIEQGKQPARRFRVEFNLAELTPELRERAWDLAPRAARAAQSTNPSTRLPVLQEPTGDPALIVSAWADHLQLVEDAADIDPEDDPIAPETDEERFVRGMHDWAQEHGSDRLRLALARGYRATGIYLDERIAADFPEFKITDLPAAAVREAINPSAAALDLETTALERLAETGLPGRVRIMFLRVRVNKQGPGEIVTIDLADRVQIAKLVEA